MHSTINNRSLEIRWLPLDSKIKTTTGKTDGVQHLQAATFRITDNNRITHLITSSSRCQFSTITVIHSEEGRDLAVLARKVTNQS